MRIVFMGSPAFALPILTSLASSHTVVGVVTQPDRPAGRGRAPTPPPVKQLALELGLPVFQPEKLREAEAVDTLRSWSPELIVVAAYGQILRPSVLELPPRGCLNVHASLLPRWRGASPVQAAIQAGDRETGITLMQMDAGMDTGPILGQARISIEKEDTGGTLSRRLAELGATLLLEALPELQAGRLEAILQDEATATYAPLLKKQDGRMDFRRPARELERQVRAYEPWPGTFVEWQNTRIGILKAHALDAGSLVPGAVGIVDGQLAVGTATGALALDMVHPAGRRPQTSADFLHGSPSFVGARLTSP